MKPPTPNRGPSKGRKRYCLCCSSAEDAAEGPSEDEPKPHATRSRLRENHGSLGRAVWVNEKSKNLPATLCSSMTSPGPIDLSKTRPDLRQPTDLVIHDPHRPDAIAHLIRGEVDGSSPSGPTKRFLVKAAVIPTKYPLEAARMASTFNIFFVHTPKAVRAEPVNAPPNTWALVASCLPSRTSRTSLSGLEAHGAELVGELGQTEDGYRMCYLRDSRALSSA